MFETRMRNILEELKNNRLIEWYDVSSVDYCTWRIDVNKATSAYVIGRGCYVYTRKHGDDWAIILVLRMVCKLIGEAWYEEDLMLIDGLSLPLRKVMLRILKVETNERW